MKSEDLQNYFMGQVWYPPLVEGENFSDEVFNDYEKENLKVLLKILIPKSGFWHVRLRKIFAVNRKNLSYVGCKPALNGV